MARKESREEEQSTQGAGEEEGGEVKEGPMGCAGPFWQIATSNRLKKEGRNLEALTAVDGSGHAGGTIDRGHTNTCGRLR
jgi:hypothetical protein